MGPFERCVNGVPGSEAEDEERWGKEAPGRGATPVGKCGTVSLRVRFMLPRCPHRRHCCMLLREFHTTRPYLRHVPDAFQLDPYTAKFETISSPRLSRLESNTRMAKKPSEGKQNEEKPHRKDGLSGTTDLSSLLQFRNRSARYPRAVEGAEGMGSRLARMQVNSNGSVPFSSAFVKRKAYLGASGSVGGSPYPFLTVFFLSTSQRSQFQMTIEGIHLI